MMLRLFANARLQETMTALGRALAIIEFDTKGNILSANQNFCDTVGYSSSEIVGQHHSMFVEPEYGRSAEYRDFWTRLARGEFEAREYKRLGKGGREVWIQASYNPVTVKGRVIKVVKVATDITEEKLRNTAYEGKIKAVSRAQAVIEFKPNGEIITANENFLAAAGYSLDEISGRHHRMFVDPVDAVSAEYASFWDRLNRGEYIAAEFKRLAKGGREIWIQASYNPIFDPDNKVIRIVKFATDITAEKLRNVGYEGKIKAITRAQAVIEFTPTGEIISANENFLGAMGYAAEEIKGRHHRMFVDPIEAASPDYAAFWDRLNRGEYVAAEFRRIAKGGREVWIQASYNPIFDMNNKVIRVVKFATDVTERVAAVRHVGEGLARLSEGDLIHRINQPLLPAFEGMRSDFNGAMERLLDTMKVVSTNSSAIHQGTSEITVAADDLSRRTEQQAASLEETAAALDEITATVRKTAEGAIHARDVVGGAKSDAEKSGEVVREAMAAMSSIEQSSRQIGQIIGVIDEIAFQTNLLALNAGVEAARAGDAGRGFAVVASEVRALAQRSAEAAKEIKALISASAHHVTTGVDLVTQTGKALERIVTKVSDINGVVTEIAASAQEQATALNQVNTAVNQMDQVTQQNAAMVEETTAASHGLAQEAEELSRHIAKFNVGQPAAVAAIRRPPGKGAGRVQLRTVSRGGGAARRAEPAEEGWEEF